jgi:hypothetical protein
MSLITGAANPDNVGNLSVLQRERSCCTQLLDSPHVLQRAVHVFGEKNSDRFERENFLLLVKGAGDHLTHDVQDGCRSRKPCVPDFDAGGDRPHEKVPGPLIQLEGSQQMESRPRIRSSM